MKKREKVTSKIEEHPLTKRRYKDNMRIIILFSCCLFLFSCKGGRETYFAITEGNKPDFDHRLIKEIIPISNGKAYVNCINGLWYADGSTVTKVVEEDITMEVGSINGNKYTMTEKKSKLYKMQEDLIAEIYRRNDIPNDLKKKAEKLVPGKMVGFQSEDPLGILSKTRKPLSSFYVKPSTKSSTLLDELIKKHK